MSPNESDLNRRRYRLNRRRLLQLAGVGVGSLTMATPGSGTARAEGDCVNGPFEQTYEAETVNVSKIATDLTDWKESEEPVENSPSDEKLEEMKRGSEDLPPAAGAQHAPDSNGLLDVRTDYEGVGDAFVIEVPGGRGRQVSLPSDAQNAVGQSKAVQVVNSSLAIFNQRSGIIERQVHLANFFEPIITEESFLGGVPKVADPRVRYDPDAERFVISTNFLHFPTVTGPMFRAASDNSNPNGTWSLYQIPPPTDVPGFADYPVLGIDKDAIYLSEYFIP